MDAKAEGKGLGSQSCPEYSPNSQSFPLVPMPQLQEVALDQQLGRSEYKEALKHYQKKLAKLHDQIYRWKIPVILAYEGWDAAGKGGNIKRITQALDPRGYKVIPIASPKPYELARHYLDRIEAHRDLNAFLDVRPEATLAQAEEADRRIAAGEAGPLTGIPIAHKDIFVTREWASTAASRMLEGYMSPFDATVVAKLKEAGMVCLGKLNCDEFAMGSGNEISAFGKVFNPWDKNAVPGGSSGGSSAAVAAGLAPIVTGTDTGGSIREPAAFTGVTGIKPTYGRPSRLGMIAFASIRRAATCPPKTLRATSA